MVDFTVCSVSWSTGLLTLGAEYHGSELICFELVNARLGIDHLQDMKCSPEG